MVEPSSDVTAAGDKKYYHQRRPEIAERIPAGVRYVVDVGCAAGEFGRALKNARPELEVRGLDVEAEQISRAKLVLDDAVQASASDGLPEHWPKPDCVVFADVLEHLVDPWTTLSDWAASIRPGGIVLVSVPNVAHYSVARAVLAGKWHYQPEGVLDRTHLRFFSRDTAISLVAEAGFRIRAVSRQIGIQKPSTSHRWLRQRVLGAAANEGVEGLVGLRRFLVDLVTLQFLIVGQKPAAEKGVQWATDARQL